MTQQKLDLENSKIYHLENFSSLSGDGEDVVFFQIFKNSSFPNTFKILFNNEDAIDKLKQISSSTGTSTPWQIYFEAIFIGRQNDLKKLQESLRPHHIGKDIYDIVENKVDEIILKTQIIEENDPAINLYNGETGVITFEDRNIINSEKIGFVYCVIHPRSMKQCKIGLSNRDPKIRAEELSIDTGLPDTFKPILFLITTNPKQLESIIHRTLDEQNLRVNKEHFHLNEEIILNTFIDNLEDNSTVLGLYVYKKNQSLFSTDLNNQIQNILKKKRIAKNESDKTDIYQSEKCQYQNAYFNSLRNTYYISFIEDSFKSINDELDSLKNDKKELELKLFTNQEIGKDITKIGSITTLAALPFDGGMSLVSAAIGALGLYKNNKSYQNKKDKLHDLEIKIEELNKRKKQKKELVKLEIENKALVLDTFCGLTYELFRKKDDFNAGFLIHLFDSQDNAKKTVAFIIFIVGVSKVNKSVKYLKTNFTPYASHKFLPYKEDELVMRNQIELNNFEVMSHIKKQSINRQLDIPALGINCEEIKNSNHWLTF
jgi:hypothetical protein